MGTARGKPPDEVMRSFWDVWLLRDVVKHKSSTHDARDLVPGCTYFCIANSDYDPSLETEQGLRILSNHKKQFFIYLFLHYAVRRPKIRGRYPFRKERLCRASSVLLCVHTQHATNSLLQALQGSIVLMMLSAAHGAKIILCRLA